MPQITILTAAGSRNTKRARLVLYHHEPVKVQKRNIRGIYRFIIQDVRGGGEDEHIEDQLDVLTSPCFGANRTAPEKDITGSELSWEEDALSLPNGTKSGVTSGEIVPGKLLELRFLWPCPLSPNGRGYYFHLHLRVGSREVPSLQLRVGRSSVFSTSIDYSKWRIYTRYRKSDDHEWRGYVFGRHGISTPQPEPGDWIQLARIYDVDLPLNLHPDYHWTLDEIDVLRQLVHKADEDLKLPPRQEARRVACLTFQRTWGDERFPERDPHRPRIVAELSIKEPTDRLNPRLSDRIFEWGAGWSYRTGREFKLKASEPAVLTGDVDHRDSWLLALRIPPKALGAPDESDVLTPGALWQRMMERTHFGGLNSLSARRPITFVPATFAEWRGDIPSEAATDDEWWLRFSMTTRVDGDMKLLAQPRFQAVVPPKRKRWRRDGKLHLQARLLTARFPNVRATDGRELTRRIKVATPDDDPLCPVALLQGRLHTTAKPVPAIALLLGDEEAESDGTASQSLRIGSLDIHLATQRKTSGEDSRPSLVLDGAPKSQQLLISRRSLGKNLDPAYEIDFRFSFHAARVDVGGQDPEFGFADEHRLFQRGRPITIPLALDEGGGAALGRELDLEVVEIANEQRSHTIEARVVKPPEGSLEADPTDVVVLDPDNFTVARVLGILSPPDGRIVASYSQSGEDAGEWALSTGPEDDMTLLAPPQVIGETFIKGTIIRQINDGSRVPLLDPSRRLDFRLAPPARLLLDRSLQPRARTTAPWNLRRLLGYSDDEAPGLPLRGVDLELLYGLPFFAGDPSFRLVEIEGWAGRLMISQSFIDVLKSTEVAASKSGDLAAQARQAYAADLHLWVAHLHKRLGHWQPFRRLRNFNAQGLREPETLSSAVSHRFRETRQTAHPFRVGSYAIDDPPGRQVRQSSDYWPEWPSDAPLYGGVDWLFESQNSYGEVLVKPRPFSTSSAVSGLALTALGGRGSQKAGFANDKTVISSETEDGRTKRVTLTRIGRIAMLWNRAKHVIVYERTVKTATRYRPSETVTDPDAAGFHSIQPLNFEGLALMRKVREYIEILEPKRSYPDFPSADVPGTGCLIESGFETRQIDVRSEWGYDTNTGWVIPLWGPVESDKEALYPKPSIQLRLARSQKRGGGGIWHGIKHPSQLLFYASNLRGDGSDTDVWDAVPEIDFDVLPDPNDPRARELRSRLSSMAEDPDGRLPDAQEVEPGYSRFTIDLEDAEEAVNLTHGRDGDGVEARVQNVMLARSSRVSRAESEPGAATADKVIRLGGSSAAMADKAAYFVSELRCAVREGRDNKIERRRLSRLATEVVEHLEDSDERRTELADDLQAKPDPGDWKSPQQALNDRFLERLNLVGEEVAKEIAREVADAIRDRKDSEEWLIALKERLTRLVDEEAVRLETQIHALETVPERIILQLEEGKRLALARMRRGLQGAVDRALQALDALEDTEAEDAQLHLRVRSKLLPLIADLRSLVRDLLYGAVESLDALPTPFLSGLRHELHGKLEEIAQQAKEILDAVEAAMAPPHDAGPDLKDIRKQLVALTEIPLESLESALNDLLNGIRGEGLEQLAALRSTLLDEVEDWRDALLEKIDALDPTDIEEELKAVAEGVASLIDDEQGALKSIREEIEHKIVDPVERAMTQFGDLVQTAEQLDKQYRVARETLDDTIDQLERAEAKLDELASQMEQDLDEVRGRLRPLENLVRDAARGELLRGSAPQVAARTLRLVRALGDAPFAGTLDYTRRRLGYYFDAAEQIIHSTPAAALFNRVPADIANALSIRQPFSEIGRRLVPDFARDFDLRRMLPDFGGLKLEDLLPDVKVPGGGSIPDWITITHGFDEKTLSAWALCDIDTELGGKPRLFDAGPVTVFLVKPRFDAHSRMELDASGGTTTDTDAKLTADIVISLGNQPVATIRKATLHYNNAGKLRVDIDARNIELAPTMQFMTDLLSVVGPDDSGVRFVLLPKGGLSTQINLPLPDLTGGPFSITSLSLNTRFDLLFAGGFALRSALWLSKPDRPFNISVLFLGGGGWFGVDVFYRPPREVRARLTIGIAAGATAAINLKVASGIAQFLLSLSVDYQTTGGGTSGPRITLGLLTYGELRVIRIVSMYIGITYRLNYDGSSGSLTGNGWLRVRIKICWCVKITVSTSVSVRFAGSDPQSAQANVKSVASVAPHTGLTEAKAAHRAHFATLSI